MTAPTLHRLSATIASLHVAPEAVHGDLIQIRTCAPWEDLERLTLVLGGNVRFGSQADICTAIGHVRFTPNSDWKSGHSGSAFRHCSK